MTSAAVGRGGNQQHQHRHHQQQMDDEPVAVTTTGGGGGKRVAVSEEGLPKMKNVVIMQNEGIVYCPVPKVRTRMHSLHTSAWELPAVGGKICQRLPARFPSRRYNEVQAAAPDETKTVGVGSPQNSRLQNQFRKAAGTMRLHQAHRGKHVPGANLLPDRGFTCTLSLPVPP